MPEPLPEQVNVLVLGRPESVDVASIEAVAPDRIHVDVLPAGSLADPEAIHPAPCGLFKHPPGDTDVPPAERDRILREAHVLVAGLPYPKELRARMPALRWAQFLYAGVSDFTHCDLWGTDVAITSGRGQVEALPIAETILGMVFVFSRNLHLAVRQTDAGTLDAGAYAMRLVQGKTLGIVGAGGIGANVAALARGVGMRVVGTRRSAPTVEHDASGLDTLYPHDRTAEMLPECDFVVLSAPLTAETEGMFDAKLIATMKPGAVILNVARGALIDEEALKDALRSGQLGGAYLDVYTNEAFGPPDPELLAMPNVVMTPHNSGKSDTQQDFALDLFRENLAKLLAGEPLENLVDPVHGY